jgi:hypothetical protein
MIRRSCEWSASSVRFLPPKKQPERQTAADFTLLRTKEMTDRVALSEAADTAIRRQTRKKPPRMGPYSKVARRWQICPQQVFGWRRQARIDRAASSPPPPRTSANSPS